MPCILCVSGSTFRPTEFLSGTSWKPYEVFHKGDVWSKKSQKAYEYSGFQAEIGSGDFRSFEDQLIACEAFLSERHTDLQRLVGFPGVKVRNLDFGVEMGNRSLLSARFPHAFLTLLGRYLIDVEISVYPGEGKSSQYPQSAAPSLWHRPGGLRAPGFLKGRDPIE